MLSIATTKEAMKPTLSAPACSAENEEAFLSRSRPVAASMVGTARRNENSTIASRVKPIASPPTIVAPERDTPGTMANAWNKPMQNALK
jgi:hypothetical protein